MEKLNFERKEFDLKVLKDGPDSEAIPFEDINNEMLRLITFEYANSALVENAVDIANNIDNSVFVFRPMENRMATIVKETVEEVEEGNNVLTQAVREQIEERKFLVLKALIPFALFVYIWMKYQNLFLVLFNVGMVALFLTVASYYISVLYGNETINDRAIVQLKFDDDNKLIIKYALLGALFGKMLAIKYTVLIFILLFATDYFFGIRKLRKRLEVSEVYANVLTFVKEDAEEILKITK